MPIVVILQLKVISNDTMEKLIAVTLQPKFAGNNTLKKSLIDLSIRN